MGEIREGKRNPEAQEGRDEIRQRDEDPGGSLGQELQEKCLRTGHHGVKRERTESVRRPAQDQEAGEAEGEAETDEKQGFQGEP